MLELEIFVHTEETKQKEIAGLNVPIAEYDLDWCTFYSIDAVHAVKDDGVEYCLIYAGGDAFYSPLTYREVKQIIEKEIKVIKWEP